jgi:hypothetical protein
MLLITIVMISTSIKKPINIDHIIRIKEKTKVLEALQDIELAQRCLLNALYDLKTEHPIDVYYRLLYT